MTQMQDSKLPANRPTGRMLHRRSARRQIFLPFMLGVLVVFIVVLIALLLQKRVQVALIADLMFTIMVLCPAFICMFAILMGMVALVTLMHNLHNSAERPLVRLEKLSETMYEKAAHYSDGMNKRTINWYSKLGPLMKVLSFFDEPQQNESQEDNHESNTQ